ncbi:MAG: alpha-glucan family phosphorylase [Candidatus Dormibacteraeota bacterium]|nr:alpha-glucan family phosphorylase [Candidatus Dormibacteraeota bacterium]
MLEELTALAFNLRWSWDPRIRRVFEVLSPELWMQTRHNPVVMLARLGASGVAEAAARPEFQQAFEIARDAAREHLERHHQFFDARAPLVIGYFSLEFGLSECLPIYSGGLGILAGDHLKAASDLNLPLVGVGLMYRWGFGRQRITPEAEQSEEYHENRPEDLPIRLVEMAGGEPLRVEAPIGNENVQICVWRTQVGRIQLFLLDTDLEENPPHLRTITDRLYVPEPDRRLRQEIVLGIGGMRALKALGIAATVFHLNEGHSALVGVERIRELRGERQLTFEEARLVARAGIVFTTHTPIAAGSDYFDPGLVWDMLGPYLTQTGLSFERFMDLGREKPGDPRGLLCSTYLALRLADVSVGVSRLHGTVSRRLWKEAWPGIKEGHVPIGSVTNGVHLPSWVADEIALLLSRHVAPDWWNLPADDPRWTGVDAIDDQELWAAHSSLRRRLAAFAAVRGGEQLDPDALTIAFSRRFAPYKRATLLLGDRERLSRLLANGSRPIQFLFSGKAHPADKPGKALLHEIVELAQAEARVTFLEDYDIDVARHLVQGADVWLNNPRRFLEASGTSGMKAAANGVLNLSVLDGWWDEAYSPEVGWAIPSGATLERPETDDLAEAEALYRLLERELLPNFYERDGAGLPRLWVGMMKASIRRLAPGFSARRMVLDYFDQAYAPAARRVQQLRLLPDWGG